MMYKRITDTFSNFSQTEVISLDNGLTVYFKENSLAPVISIQLWVKTGSIHEGNHLGCGLSHFLEHMIFQGSNKYPGLSATELVHQYGGDINAYTSYGCTVFYIDLPSSKASEAIDILIDMVANPLFPKKRFLDEKNVILRERDMLLDHPGRVLSEKQWQTVFTTHPVRHPIIGYKEKIESVDRGMMVEYYNARYSPTRSFLVISGEANLAKCLKTLEKSNSTWLRGNISESPVIEEPPQFCQRNQTFTFNDPLARIAIAFQSPKASSPDVPALDILAGILENGNSSRLTKILRNQKHLANNIDTYNFNTYFCGVFGINALCTLDKNEELVTAIFNEINKITKNGVKQAEIDRVVNQQKTDYFRSLKSNKTVAGIIGNTVLSYDSPVYADNYIDAINKVTIDDIVHVTEKYLSSAQSSIVKQLPQTSRSKQKASKQKKRSSTQTPVTQEKLHKKSKCIFIPYHHLPLVDICVILPGGSIMETKDNSGISHLLAATLLTGTKKYPENKLADILDSNAIDLAIHSGNNTVSIRLNCHKEELDLALDILQSILCEPAFSEKKFLREKKNKLESLQSRKLSPQNAAEDKLTSLLYGTHPYALPVVGLIDSVKNISIEDIELFYYNTCLNQNKLVFGLAGDYDHQHAQTKLQELLTAIPWAKSPRILRTKKPIFPSQLITSTVSVPREQAVVMLGQPGCDMKNKEHFALDILQVSLNSMSSRLYKKIREDLGLAYYVGMFSSRGIHPGFFGLYAGTQPSTSEKVLKLLDAERKLIAKQGLKKDEFEASKACINNELNEQDLNSKVLLFNSVLSEFYGIGYKRPWTLRKTYQQLSISDINTTLSDYLSSPCQVNVIAQPKS